MNPRRFNGMMFIFSCIGGLIGCAVGEVILTRLGGNIPDVLLIGIYFGQLALFTGIMCLLAENINPVLNGTGWKLRYSKTSWLLLFPFMFIALLAAGALFQFIYGLDPQKVQNSAEDIVMVIDSSGSMAQTDPDNERLKAAQLLVQKMTPKNRVAVIAFNGSATILQPMTQVTDTNVQNDICKKISENQPNDGTDIGNALNATIQHIKDSRQKGRGPIVILLSDGVSEVDLANTVNPYKSDSIPIYTVGMKIEDPYGTDLLNSIANETGGSYTKVEDVKDLKNILQSIYDNKDRRLLVDNRMGSAHASLLHAFLRVLFILLIGSLIGIALGLVFDNKYLLKGFAIGGAVSGLVAGLILEAGFNLAPELGLFYRACADVILAAVFTIFSLSVVLDSNSQKSASGRYGSGSSRSAGFDGDRSRGTKSF